MSLDPTFWPQKVSELSNEHRSFWRDYWEQDLPVIRVSYPELAHWDDLALIAALANFNEVILRETSVNTARDLRFLEWLRLSCQDGHRLDKEAFHELEESATVTQ